MKPRKFGKARFRRRQYPPLPQVALKEVIEVDTIGNRLWRLPEVAERLQMAINTLKDRIRKGEIAACYIGSKTNGNKNRKGIRISEAEIQRYIAANEVRIASSV